MANKTCPKTLLRSKLLRPNQRNIKNEFKTKKYKSMESSVISYSNIKVIKTSTLERLDINKILCRDCCEIIMFFSFSDTRGLWRKLLNYIRHLGYFLSFYMSICFNRK